MTYDFIFYIQSDEPISNSASDSINFRVTCIDKSSVVTLLLTTDSSQQFFYEKVYVQLPRLLPFTCNNSKLYYCKPYVELIIIFGHLTQPEANFCIVCLGTAEV